MSRKEKHIDLIESEIIILREGVKYHLKWSLEKNTVLFY